MPKYTDFTRRHLLLAGAALGLTASKATALVLTPTQTRGPFYPLALPLDRDNDLVTVAGQGLAKGEIVNVAGQVLDTQGQPVPGALVEIWQCDVFGRYHHPGDRRNVPLDPNFQGYGQYTTGTDGGYRFRTIKPVPYPGRTPHIHFQVSGSGITTLVTQMYLADVPENDKDFIYKRIRDAQARASVTVDFAAGSDGLPLGRFDIVLQKTG